MQPEARLVGRIKSYISGRGGRCFKIHGGDNPFQEVGIPDLLICYEGRFIGLEVKMPGREASPRQAVVLKSIRAAGGIGETVESVAQVEEILKRIRRKGSK